MKEYLNVDLRLLAHAETNIVRETDSMEDGFFAAIELADSILENGYDPDSPIEIEVSIRVTDGARRLKVMQALQGPMVHTMLRESKIPCNVTYVASPRGPMAYSNEGVYDSDEIDEIVEQGWT